MIVPPDTVALADYERHFLERAEPRVRAYVAGAAADGITRGANRAAFDRMRLLPRVLVPMRGATARSELFGAVLDHPILLAPTAFHRLVHPDGERATVAGAALARAWTVISAQASQTLEEIAAEAGAPLWFQLYARPRIEATLSLVRRAEDAGFRAIVLTVDAPVSGIRNAEQRAGFRLPPGVRAVNLDDVPEPVVARTGSPVFEGLLDAAPTWETVGRLRAATSLPLLLKGVLHPADAARALEEGVDGIVVSNHGGRVLDTTPASLEALPAVVEAVAGRAPVLLDGGIRRGTDVLKALALGARAVLVGQPILHGLALAGAAGVAHVLTILQTEFEAAMALTGRPTLADIDRSVLFD